MPPSESAWRGPKRIENNMDPTIKDFESATAELDAIVRKLEEGDLPLEQSMQLYERGLQLSRFCHAKIEEAERRIELLNERGELRAAPAALGLSGDDESTRAAVKGTPTAIEGWLDLHRRTIDAALQRFLPTPPAVPSILSDAMRYSVMAGGKRLRPLLVLAAAEAVATHSGLDDDQARELALPAACAIELIHTYSLVHDDLPAMDDDTLRRGRPTAHVVFGEGQAILSGDALHTEAFTLMAREPAPGTAGLDGAQLADRKLRAIDIVADAAGARGMAGGQALDLQAAAPRRHPSIQRRCAACTNARQAR